MKTARATIVRAFACLALLAASVVHAVKETRPIAATVTHVISEQSVTIKAGSTPSLVLDGPPELLADLKTDVQGERLTIARAGKLKAWNRNDVKVEVVLPDLNELTNQGAGDASIQGFDLDALTIDSTASGDVDFQGRCQTLQVRLSGSGDVSLTAPGDFVATTLNVEATGSGDLKAADFKAQRVNLGLAGSGDAVVYATEAVTVRSAGSGDLEVRGNPAQRNVDSQGSGTVKFKLLRV